MQPSTNQGGLQLQCMYIHVYVCTALLPTLLNQLSHALSALPRYTNSACSIQCKDFM